MGSEPTEAPAARDRPGRRQALAWCASAGLGALLAACGGGDGGSGVPVVPGGTPTPTPTPAPTPSPTPAPTPTPGGTLVVLSDSLGEPMVQPLATRTGRLVADWSIGGQTSAQVANRALGFTISLQEPRIVAGSNAVLAINGVAIAEAPDGNVSHRVLSGAGEIHALTGTLGTVHGTLTRTLPGGVETYRFVPDAGAVLPAPLPDDSAFAPDVPDGTVIYLAGRNNFFDFPGHPEFGAAPILADARRIVAAFPRALILTVSNGDFGPPEYAPDGGLYLQIAAINDGLAPIAGARFLDHVRIAKDQGLALAGLAADAQSEIDRQHDVIAHQLRRDGLHGNAAGGDVFAQIVATKLAELGW